MTPAKLLSILPPFQYNDQLIAKHQDVHDIVGEILEAHQVFSRDYDRIAGEFAGGSVEKKLYDFCRNNIAYKVEKEKRQTSNSPAALLTLQKCDCKGYAQFIGGILDALNRSGRGRYNWVYRFGVYPGINIFDEEDDSYHVFVVVKRPDGSETWIDPVLDAFNKRYPSPESYEDLKPVSQAAAVGDLYRVSGPRNVGASASQGQQLADALHNYELGLVDAVNALSQKNQVSTGIDEILKAAAASSVPGAAQAMAIASAVAAQISSTFGPGSTLSRVVTALTSGNVLTAPLNAIKALFSGRTFNTDSYLGAWDYYYHVVGVNRGDSTGIADSEVPEALKWFVTKLGIFISGRAHLAALRNGVDQYMSLVNVSPYTTQDRVRVEYARQVLLTYMPICPSPNCGLGGWKNAVGVYDDSVTAAIFKARTMSTAAQQDTSGTVPVSVDVPGTIAQFAQANPLVTVGLAVAIGYVLYELFKE